MAFFFFFFFFLSPAAASSFLSLLVGMVMAVVEPAARGRARKSKKKMLPPLQGAVMVCCCCCCPTKLLLLLPPPASCSPFPFSPSLSLSLFSPLSASSAQCSFHFFSTRLSCILILVSERVSEVQSYACAAAVSFAATSSLSAAAGDGGHEGRRRCIPRRRRQAVRLLSRSLALLFLLFLFDSVWLYCSVSGWWSWNLGGLVFEYAFARFSSSLLRSLPTCTFPPLLLLRCLVTKSKCTCLVINFYSRTSTNASSLSEWSKKQENFVELFYCYHKGTCGKFFF